MTEGTDAIDRSLAGNRASTVAESRKHRRIAGERILEADLGVDTVLVGNHDAGLANMLEANILAPQPVAVATINLNAHRHIPQGDVDQCQLRLMFADRRASLALKGRINHRKLPGGRWLLRHNAVAAAVEMQVVDHVAGVI